MLGSWWKYDAYSTSARMIEKTYGFKPKYHPGQCKESKAYQKII